MKSRDALRAFVRQHAGKGFYRMLARAVNAAFTLTKQGMKTYKTLHCYDSRQIEDRKLNLKNIPFPVLFRTQKSDVNAITQNLIREEYGKLPRLTFEPKIILDGGAYIGDLTVYFLNRFPNAKVFALEPDPRNFVYAEKNLKPYGNRVRLLNKGLWNSETKLALQGENTGARLVETLEDQESGIACTTVPNLMREYGVEGFDLVKLDIEGAEEKVLLSGSAGWLSKTKVLIIEFHGHDLRERCLNYLKQQGFEGYSYRSLHYLFKS